MNTSWDPSNLRKPAAASGFPWIASPILGITKVGIFQEHADVISTTFVAWNTVARIINVPQDGKIDSETLRSLVGVYLPATGTGTTKDCSERSPIIVSLQQVVVSSAADILDKRARGETMELLSHKYIAFERLVFKYLSLFREDATIRTWTRGPIAQVNGSRFVELSTIRYS